MMVKPMSDARSGKRAVSLVWGGLLSLLLAADASAADINLVGNWSTQIGASNLVAGIGSQYVSPIESDSAQATVTINNTADGAWRVWVRQDGSLPAGVTLGVRRTGNGSGGGGISGGTSYLTLTGSEQELFNGSMDRTGVTLQLGLFGVSVSHPAGTGGCSVIYRVSQP